MAQPDAPARPAAAAVTSKAGPNGTLVPDNHTGTAAGARRPVCGSGIHVGSVAGRGPGLSIQTTAPVKTPVPHGEFS